MEDVLESTNVIATAVGGSRINEDCVIKPTGFSKHRTDLTEDFRNYCQASGDIDRFDLEDFMTESSEDLAEEHARMRNQAKFNVDWTEESTIRKYEDLFNKPNECLGDFAEELVKDQTNSTDCFNNQRGSSIPKCDIENSNKYNVDSTEDMTDSTEDVFIDHSFSFLETYPTESTDSTDDLYTLPLSPPEDHYTLPYSKNQYLDMTIPSFSSPSSPFYVEPSPELWHLDMYPNYKPGYSELNGPMYSPSDPKIFKFPPPGPRLYNDGSKQLCNYKGSLERLKVNCTVTNLEKKDEPIFGGMFRRRTLRGKGVGMFGDGTLFGMPRIATLKRFLKHCELVFVCCVVIK